MVLFQATGSGGAQAGVACSFPSPWSIPLGTARIGISFDGGLTGSMSLSVFQNDCDVKLEWSGGGFARLAIGVSAEFPPNDIADFKISASSGFNCPLSVENNEVVCRLAHSGLVLTWEAELQGGFSVAGTQTVIQPGGDIPVSFGLPALN